MVTSDRTKWFALALLCAVQFMVILNTSQQVGGAVGLALLSTIAVSTTEDELARGVAQPSALTEGLANAFWAGAAIAFVGMLVSIFLVRRRDLRVSEPALEDAALREAA
jgi:hypothetical protein